MPNDRPLVTPERGQTQLSANQRPAVGLPNQSEAASVWISSTCVTYCLLMPGWTRQTQTLGSDSVSFADLFVTLAFYLNKH